MRISKFYKRIIGIIIFVWLIAGVSIISMTNAVAIEEMEKDNIYSQMRLFSEVYSRLMEFYVTEIPPDTLIDAAIEAMIEKLDPHTIYFDEEEFREFQSDTKGEFSGLGISISKRDGYITVVSPIEGTPAYRMGILAGDRIVEVNGEDIKGISTNESIKKMRGKRGTSVLITIERPGVTDLLDFNIVRDIIKVKSIPYAFKFDNGVGYIRIRQFNETTTSELVEAIDKLEKENITGLIVDLRFNPGGLLSEAVSTVNEFIGKKKLVVFTQGRFDRSNAEYQTKNDSEPPNYPVVCLINEASASAAEIFAGSLQDWDKGLIVGKTSFGKGSVQQLLPVSKGGIKVTTAKYYIKSGRCINKDINDKLLRGIEVSDEEKEKIDEENHIKKFFTQNGREVYGGGGIVPDIEFENAPLTELGVKLKQKNAFFNFSVEYYSKYENEIDEDFKVDDDIRAAFFEYLDNDSLSYSKTSLDSILPWIDINLESNIIGKKFGEIPSYKIALKIDAQLQSTIELFDKFSSLTEMFSYAESLKKENLTKNEKHTN